MIIENAIYLLARILPKNETLLVKFILPNWWSYLLHKYDIPACSWTIGLTGNHILILKWASRNKPAFIDITHREASTENRATCAQLPISYYVSCGPSQVSVPSSPNADGLVENPRDSISGTWLFFQSGGFFQGNSEHSDIDGTPIRAEVLIT